MARKELFGTKAKVGGTVYVVPPLTLKQLRNGVLEMIKQHDEMVDGQKGLEVLELRGKIIHQALLRNYPDLTEDALFEQLDLRNTGEIWSLIMGASGFTQAATEVKEEAETQLPPGT